MACGSSEQRFDSLKFKYDMLMAEKDVMSAKVNTSLQMQRFEVSAVLREKEAIRQLCFSELGVDIKNFVKYFLSTTGIQSWLHNLVSGKLCYASLPTCGLALDVNFIICF
uniref:Uncharacterized protein n=1 Tax=Salix viminalis TaxID=40686 RepID=A0A6N2N223_SALVM